MIVIVHGYDGSGPGHWQHWLYEELKKQGAAVSFPQLSDPLDPSREVWVRELDEVVRSSPTPVVFVAHSLGCWAVDHYLSTHGAQRVLAALLVTPPSPDSLFEPIQSFFPPALDPRAWEPLRARSWLIGSDNDDYAEAREIEKFAARIGLSHKILSGVGHINASSGFGPFPLALEWLKSLEL